MVKVYVTRHALESDPLEVIFHAQRQAIAEREAARIAVKSEYCQDGEFVELHISGAADPKMREFLGALRGFGITGCTVDVDRAEEEIELGEIADSFDVCTVTGGDGGLSGSPQVSPR